MKKICNITPQMAALWAAVIFSSLLTSGCTCGFDCSSDNDDNATPVSLTLLFSDALPDELKEVVISVDRIEFVRDTGQTIDVDTFSISRLNLEGADTFEIDLLTVNGNSPLTVLESQTLEPDFYEKINIYINDAAPDLSYVLDATDMRRPLTVPGNVLAVNGRQFNGGPLELVVEFGLAQALQFIGDEAGYRLTTDGIRLQNTATAVNLRGSISSELLDATPGCDSKTDPLTFNRVYIYEGEPTTLADLFTEDSAITAPEGAIAPFAVASLQPSTGADTPLSYFFSYLPQGDYTVAFTCNAENDDPTDYDGITVPEPAEQAYPVSLPTSGETYECNLSTEVDCDA